MSPFSTYLSGSMLVLQIPEERDYFLTIYFLIEYFLGLADCWLSKKKARLLVQCPVRSSMNRAGHNQINMCRLPIWEGTLVLVERMVVIR